MTARPKDAQMRYHGSYYKIGLHDLVFMWKNGDWERSTKQAEEIRREIAKRKADAQKRREMIEGAK